MKSKTIINALILPLFAAVLLTSCKSSSIQYNKVYTVSHYAVLRDGFWGEWKSAYYYSVSTNYDSESLEIRIYHGSDHPADYSVKITIDKTTCKITNKKPKSQNDIVCEYQGVLSSQKIPIIDLYRSLLSYNSDVRCTIRCDADIQKSITQNGLYGTMNVFYGDGLGNAFSFGY
jgi:hypothetical protein